VALITKVEPQKNKKRVNIYLDGKFGFGLDLENYAKLRLEAGQQLTEREIEEIVKKSQYKVVFDKLINYATLRPRSEKEIETWFGRHKIHKSLRSKSRNKLKKLGLIGDEKFSQWWVEQRLQFKSKSKRELRSELYVKGVGKEIIEDVLENAGVDETKSAKRLVEKNMYKWQKFSGFDKRKRISAYLARKGFSWSVITKVVEDD
jgi:regulatory protein